jgi:uncharacterized protein YqeY
MGRHGPGQRAFSSDRIIYFGQIWDAERLSTLRMMLSELQYKEKEKGLAVDQSAAVQVLQSMVRKRRDAAEQFEKGGRQDLASQRAG